MPGARRAPSLHARGVGVVLAAIAAVELLDRLHLHVPNPVPLILLALVYAVFAGGDWDAVVGAALTVAFAAYFFSLPGHPLTYTPNDRLRVLVVALTIPAVTFLVLRLRRRAEAAAREARRRADRLEALYRVGSALLRPLGLDALLAAALEAVVAVTEAGRGELFLLDGGMDGAMDGEARSLAGRAGTGGGPGGGAAGAAHDGRPAGPPGGASAGSGVGAGPEPDGAELVRRACHPAAPEASEVRQPASAGLLGEALRTGAAVSSPDVAADPRYFRQRDAARLGEHALLAVPLLAAGRPLGVLVLIRHHRHPFGPDEVALTTTLAGHVATALENARLFDAERRARARLQEANRALERASRVKSEFLAGMSHELRTPLNAILGFTELLIDDGEGLPAETRGEYLQNVHAAGRHLLGLINDILDLAKVEAGRMELHPEAVDLEGAVASALATLQPLATRRGVATHSAAAGRVWADPAKLRQILYNLLSNAIKFTPQGGTITVTAERDAAGYVVTVADTGPGIAPADRERIFGEFEQAGGGLQEGTGLGLALTRRFVELHGGRLWVEGGEGQGSRFRFLLPAAADPGGPTPEVEGGRGPLVLVVDDDARAAHLITRALQAGGYRTAVVGDGAGALEAARRLRPAAITVDVLLPGLDGWEVLRRLKAEPATRDIPVVVISVVDEHQWAYALGAADYFVKPVDRQALLDRLGRYAPAPAGRARPVGVLVIDDDAAARRLVRDILTPEGFVVTEAGDGALGLELAARARPDVILCDLLMPEMSGFEVVARLRADPRTAGIPVLVLTAHDLTAEDKRALNGRVLAVLHKQGTGRVDLLGWLEGLAARLDPAEEAAPRG